MQKGLLVPGVSQLSGFSGGALTSVLIAAGVPPREMLAIYRDSSLFCNGTLPDRWWQRPLLEAKAALRSYAEECMKTARWPLDVVGVREREGERRRREGEKRGNRGEGRKKKEERKRENEKGRSKKKNSKIEPEIETDDRTPS